MSMNRIQMLLLSEYRGLEDVVLVESPFAETTKAGSGVRQVNIGLTPTKLVIAMDVLPDASTYSVKVPRGVDPKTETLELISVVGVECLNLSVYHNKKRQTLKARYCNGCVAYYELGGFEFRRMYWNLWCERIRFLSPGNELIRSCSETSAASSTSCSTQYVMRNTGDGDGMQIWCKHVKGGQAGRMPWTEKDLFLGNKLEQITALNCKPKNDDTELKLLYRKPKRASSRLRRGESQIHVLYPTSSQDTNGGPYRMERVESVPRFGVGVEEKCTANLLLGPYGRRSSDSLLDVSRLCPIPPPNPPMPDLSVMADLAVRLWEHSSAHSLALMREQPRGRHRRRYALSPHPHFLHGMGPWHVSSGERYSVQVKRAVSVVAIRRVPHDPEMQLSLSKRQLTATVSCENLHLFRGQRMGTTPKLRMPTSPALLFWTPDYWYRPRPVRAAYIELHEHLRGINCYHASQKHKAKKSLFRRSKKTRKVDPDSDEDENWESNRKSIGRNSKMSRANDMDSPLAQLRSALSVDIPVTAWNFDSTTLAYQLTMADRELFLKIPSEEFSILIWQQTSKNAPNIAAFIAFSHRISCLVTTAVIAQDDIRRRARLIARFIYTAKKCDQIHNFQSCFSVLAGLQSPPCFRLKDTWSYVRYKHASMNTLFEQLCRLYRDPRLPAFQKAFYRAKQTAPYLPFIGQLLSQLLDRIPYIDDAYLTRPSEEDLRTSLKNSTSSPVSMSASSRENSLKKSVSSSTPDILRRFLSAFKIWPTQSSSTCDLSRKQIHVARKALARWKQYSRGYTDMDIINNYVRFFQPILGDNRIQRLEEVVGQLKVAQKAAGTYALKLDTYAREYLFKSRYREDKENFVLSLRIEG